MRRLRCALFALALAGCGAAQAQGGCEHDTDCTLVDVCGCSCSAVIGPTLPPVVCSIVCGGHPCAGHRAVCASGTCVMR